VYPFTITGFDTNGQKVETKPGLKPNAMIVFHFNTSLLKKPLGKHPE